MSEVTPLLQPALGSVASIGLVVINVGHSGGVDIADSTYVLESMGLKGKVLEAAEGDRVALADYASAEGQHWGISRVQPGTYRVVNASTRKALQGGHEGSEVVQELWSACEAQTFSFWSVAGGGEECFRITVTHGEAVAVDPSTKSVITGGDDATAENGNWILRRVSGPMPKPSCSVQTGIYIIRPLSVDDRVLTRKSMMSKAGDPVLLQQTPKTFLVVNTNTGSTHTHQSSSRHFWEIVHVRDSYYKLESISGIFKAPVLAADDTGACTLQYWDDAADNMLWEVQLEGPSQRSLWNKKYQKALGVSPDGVSVRLLAGAVRPTDSHKLWDFVYNENQTKSNRCRLIFCVIITVVPVVVFLILNATIWKV